MFVFRFLTKLMLFFLSFLANDLELDTVEVKNGCLDFSEIHSNLTQLDCWS